MAAIHPPPAPATTPNNRWSSCVERAAAGAVGELIDIADTGDKIVVIMRPPAEDDEQAALSANLTTLA